MSSLQYHIVGYEGQESITVFVPGQGAPLVATTAHPNYRQIVEAAETGDLNVVALMDPATEVRKAIESRNLSARVKVEGGTVYFDGEPVHNSVTKQIVRVVDEGYDSWGPLVRFMERLAENPVQHSRDQLHSWLDREDFTINYDGRIVGYKGVRVTDTGLESIMSGRALVDGVEYEGNIPNYLGAIVEMPRPAVTHDPNVGCSYGLHVGTFDYASKFAQGALLVVLVDPADVVSVPTECDAAKMRVCKYEVEDVLETYQPFTSAFRLVIDTDPYADEDDFYECGGDCEDCDCDLDDEDYCDFCGSFYHFTDDCPELEDDDDLDENGRCSDEDCICWRLPDGIGPYDVRYVTDDEWADLEAQRQRRRQSRLNLAVNRGWVLVEDDPNLQLSWRVVDA